MPTRYSIGCLMRPFIARLETKAGWRKMASSRFVMLRSFLYPGARSRDHWVLGRHRVGEPAPETGDHEARRVLRVGDDVDDVLALEASRVAQEPLLAVVVVVGVEEELAGRVVEAPAGKGAGRLADVSFRVRADAHREALHELPGEVLVRVGLVVHAGVEPDQHRRVLRDRLGEGLERARAESAEELVLVVHEVGVADLLVRGGELLAHEKDELLPKRRVGHDHPVEPPGRELDELLVVVVVVAGDARLRDRRQVRDA